MHKRGLYKQYILIFAILITVAAVDLVGAQEPVVIRYTNWNNSESIVRIMNEIVAEFEELHPNIKVEFEPIAWPGEAGYLERIVTWIAGDVAPDIITVPFPFIPYLSEQGVLLPIDPFVARDAHEVMLDDIVDIAVEASSWNGQMYGLPYELGLWWVNVNQTAFEQVGLQDPLEIASAGDWTWETMLDAARRITRRTSDGTVDRWGILTFPGDVGVYPWLWAHGGDLLSEDRTRSRIGDEESVASIEAMHRLMYDEGVLAFPEWMGFPQIAAPWPGVIHDGAFGMQPWWSSVLSDLYIGESVVWDYDVVPFPTGPGGSITNASHIHTVAIYSGSRNAEAAWEFVKYMSGDGYAKLSTAAPGFGPVRMSQFPEWAAALESTGVEGMLRFFEEAIGRTRLRPRHSRMMEIESTMQENLRAVWGNEAPVRNVLEQTSERINQLLSEN